MRRQPVSRLGVALLAVGLAIGSHALGVLEPLEAKTIDLRFQARGTQPTDDIVVVAIDEATFGDLAERWPFRRSLHARAIRRLKSAGVRQIAYDVQFTEQTEPREDLALFEAVASAPGTVLSTADVDAKGTRVLGGDKNLAEIGARAANTVLPADADGVVRRMPFETAGLESFAPVTVEAVRGRPVGRDGFSERKALIDYHGPPGTIRTVSFIDLIRGQVPDRLLRGRIAVVGVTPVSLKDVFRTPTTGDEVMSGAEIQANAISTVLRGVPLRRAPFWLALTLIAFFGVAVPLARLRIRTRWAAGFAVLLLIALLAGAMVAFELGTVVGVVDPLLALVLATAGTLGADVLRSSRERRRTRAMFARFVPEAVVSQLVEQSGGAPLQGSRMQATVMFTDLRGFTTFSETRPAEQVVEVLNRYLSEMSEAILDHGGTVVSYMGDGIMAVFGSPIERDDHADVAFAAAREMLGVRLQRVNRWLAARDMSPFVMGVGLNSGEVMSGNIGSERRLEYAAIGDTTNVAARLETATKGVPGGLLVSGSTRALLECDRELLDLHGSLQVKGREAEIETWCLADAVGISRPAGEPMHLSVRRRRAE